MCTRKKDVEKLSCGFEVDTDYTEKNKVNLCNPCLKTNSKGEDA